MLALCLWSMSLVVASPPPAHSAAIVFEVADKLGGCAVGDVDPARPGNEIVVTSAKGVVFVLCRDPRELAGWKSEVAYRSPGEMIQVAVGDADPKRPGNEIVVVGMAEGPESDSGPGAAALLFKEGESWKSERIFEEDSLVHGVAVGDAGVFVTGYDRMVHLLRRSESSGRIETVSSAALPGAGKAALAVQGGVVVACTDGSLVRAIVAEGGRLETTVIDKRESGRARLGTDGARILACDDDGTLSIVTDAGSSVLFKGREGKKLRGAVLADLDPATPGLEAATTGYSGRVLAFYPSGPDGRGELSPSPHVLLQDRAGFHHAAAGDLDGEPGDELVVCGLAGRVIVFKWGEPSRR